MGNHFASFASRTSITLFFCVLAACSSKEVKFDSKSAPEFQAWTELGPESVLIARVVTSADVCPVMDIDANSRVPMLERAPPSGGFTVRSCELVIPSGTMRARVEGPSGVVELPLSRRVPKKIVVIGDTGCRVKSKSSSHIQECSNPEAWPFPQIMKQVVAEHPDLVIHVGDYLYREGEGYGWQSWKEDFFEPAQPLLGQAPWIFVRGNHELCSRAGDGWFRYLDPRDYPSICSDRTDAYKVSFDHLALSVLDSSAANDSQASPDDVTYYTNQLGAIEASGGSHWILTHRPFWALYGKSGTGSNSDTGTMNATLQESAQKAGLLQKKAALDVVLSGHIHLFEALTFQDGGPSQLVIGNGGTLMELDAPVALARAKYNGAKVGSRVVDTANIKKDFGYLTLERASHGDWLAVAHLKDGTKLESFTFHRKKFLPSDPAVPTAKK